MILVATDEEKEISKNNKKLFNNHMKYINYIDKLCIKPWGHEYLLYENNRVAIWVLRINKGHATSLHCHFKKDTLLFTLHGCGKINLINDEEIILNPLKYVFIPRNKFHALSTYSDYSYFLEIEIFGKDLHFSDKNDLLRINDIYNRESRGYENSVSVIGIDDFKNCDSYYKNFIKNLTKDTFFNVEKTEIALKKSLSEISDKYSKHSKYILLKGNVLNKKNMTILKEGSILDNYESLENFESLDDEIEILELTNNYAYEDSKIIYDFEQLNVIKKELDKKKQRIVLTSGCFDILHVGHLEHLREAKKEGDILLVCLSNDEQIKKLKGKERPINNYEDRINLFKSIPYVDYIILYSEENIDKEETLGKCMKIVKPYVWTKGDDYTIEQILAKHPYLSKVKIIPNIMNKSTTNIVRKIKSENIL